MDDHASEDSVPEMTADEKRRDQLLAAPHAVEIERLAVAPAREWRDPSIAIAAREQRQRALVQVGALRQQGVVVLDEPDDQLDRAVFDAYLRLRSRKRV